MQEWLASIGLGGHVAAFQASGIARDQLGALTDADLRELGLNLGERKRFLRAALGDATAPLPEPYAAERRPLSMMFVDLVGSSRLAEKLAPEDLMELLRRYGDFCAGPIDRYGGRVTRMVGDGILAYFCYPVANENDPERAVRAALEIARGVGALAVPSPGAGAAEPLAVRIGIATGPVVVGDLRTAGGTYRHTVVGSAPNLAARMQGLVPPGGIAIGEATWRRVRERFVCADLGSYELRGLSQPHPVWQVLREGSVHGRTARARPASLCGRVAEMQAMRAAWARARAGDGGLVLLCGEPGIGKSRLLQAFLQESGAGEDGPIVLEGSAFETDSPLRPVIAWLQRAARSGDEDAPTGSARLALSLRDWTACAPALAPLLGPAPAVAGTPEQQREAILTALTRLLLAQAEQRPLRLVLEDAQWFDPTTLELAARIGAACAGRRVLIVLTARADFPLLPALGWPALPAHATRLDLLPLAEAEVAQLAASMLPGGAATPALLGAIGRKAGGVPLFVEEVVRALAARGDAGLADAAAAEPLIPASVHELLAGRLDRLGEAKEIAQAAAVIGGDIRSDVLALVCAARFATTRAVLDDALDLLVRAGILTEAANGQRGGAFTHALLRDAAYDSLLRGPRQALHLEVAKALLACDPDLASTQPELLALHMTEGADPEASLPYWLAAGRLSLTRSALTEATRLLGRGLDAMQTLPHTPQLIERRLEFMALLGPAVMALHGYGSQEAQRLYAAANALCQELPDSDRYFPIYWGWWRVSRDFFHMLDRAHELLARARQRGSPALLLQAHHCGWASEFHRGNFARCCEHIDSGLSIYHRHDLRDQAHAYGNHDAKVCAHGQFALILWMMGRPVAALEQDRLALAHAERLGHVGSTVHFSEIHLVRHAFRRDVAKALELGRDLSRLAGEHGMEDARVKGMIFAGWAAATGGDPAAGLRLLEEGFARQRDIGTSEDFPIYVALQAEMLMAAGEPERAMQALHDAVAEFDRTGLRFWRPELRRLQARALLQADPHGAAGSALDPARALLEDAIAIAQEQDAAMLALRAAVALARLDPSAAALARLRASLGAVAEDDGGPDMAAARTMLAASAPAALASG